MLLRNSPEVGERHTDRGRSCPTARCMVEADERQIRQIIWNLATNGLRAMPNGGTLRLSAPRRTPGDGRPRRPARRRTKASALPPEELERIFQPFRGSFGKGTGLGLAIVHRIVTDYGGRIDVQLARRGRARPSRCGFPPARPGFCARDAAPVRSGAGSA